MVLDITIIVLLLLFAIHGFRKGFLFSVIHTFGWVLAIVGAFFITPFAKEYLLQYSPLQNWFFQSFKNRFSDSSNAITSSYDSLPENISGKPGDIANTAVNAAANTFTTISLTVLAFVALFLVIKILVWILLKFMDKKHRDGFSGAIDGIFGMLLGIVKGVIFVLLLMILLIPVINLSQPVLTSAITEQLQTSLFSKILYNKNIFIDLINTLF